MIIPTFLPANTAFKATLSGDSKYFMGKVLTPLIDNFTPVKEMAQLTEYTEQQINSWSCRVYGMTVTKLYRARQNKELEKDFLEYKEKNISVSEVAKKHGHSIGWVRRRYKEMGLDTFQIKKSKLKAENIPWMLEAGYSLVRMKRELNLSINAIIGWMYREYGCGIREYKQSHNIHFRKK